MLPTTTAAAAEEPKEPDDIALKVGLGVGIPLAVLSITVLIVAWRIRRARKRRAVTSEAHHKAEAEFEKPELAADPVVVPAELDTDPPELPAQILEAELPEEGIMAELPGRFQVAPQSSSAQEPKSLQEQISERITTGRPS